MIPLTDSNAFDALHDELSRQLRIYPARGDGESAFVLYEDDGVSRRHEDGEFAEIRFELRSTPRSIELRAQRGGNYAVQAPIRVVLMGTERRRLALRGEGVALVA